MSEDPHSRRKFLKYLGLSSAGVTLATIVQSSKEKIKAGGDDAKEEIEKLKKVYEELGARSKWTSQTLLDTS